MTDLGIVLPQTSATEPRSPSFFRFIFFDIAQPLMFLRMLFCFFLFLVQTSGWNPNNQLDYISIMFFNIFIQVLFHFQPLILHVVQSIAQRIYSIQFEMRKLFELFCWFHRNQSTKYEKMLSNQYR